MDLTPPDANTLGFMSLGPFASTHGAFVAVLVGTLWPHATSITSRALLLAYMTCIAVALIINSAHSPAAVLGCYVIGFGAVGFATYLLRPRQ